jgi:ubiquinone/menaquinone biosynthesis C-methylase UbiE
MVMGLIPNQLRCLSEMKRVLKPSGILAISTHGPREYSNINEIGYKVCMKNAMRKMTGYRAEYWPWNEKTAYKFLDKVGFKDQKVKRLTWFDELSSPEKVWQFYSSTTSLWWFERFSEEKSKLIKQLTIDEMRKKRITGISIDVIFCFGRK